MGSDIGVESASIYVVQGSSGECSDYREWLCAAYQDEALAQAHVAAATEWLQQHPEPEDRWGEQYYAWAASNPFDPDIEMDYTGVHYTYFAVPLRNELPAEKASHANR